MVSDMVVVRWHAGSTIHGYSVAPSDRQSLHAQFWPLLFFFSEFTETGGNWR